jgi:hypothetical protein
MNVMNSTSRTARIAASALGVLLLLSSVPARAQSQFVPITPCRVIDTRTDPGPGGGASAPLTGGQTRSFSVKGLCGIPSNATAVSYKVSAVSPTGTGFMTLWPFGQTRPNASVLFFTTGSTIANGGIVPLTAGSPDLNAYAETAPAAMTVHMVVDVTGYFL